MSYNPYSPPAGYQTEEKSAGQQWASQDSVGLRRVSLGLSLMFYSFVLLILIVIGGGVAGAAIGAQAGRQAGRGPAAQKAVQEAVAKHPAMLAVGLLGAFCGLMSLVGQCLCLNVPDESNVKGYILTAVVAQMFGFGMNMMSSALQFTGQPQNPIIALVAALAGGFALIMFMIFLKGLAEFVRRLDLAERAKSVLMHGALVYFMMFVAGVMMVVAVLAMKPQEAIPLILGAGCMLLIFGIYSIVVGIRYVLLLGSMSTAVSP